VRRAPTHENVAVREAHRKPRPKSLSELEADVRAGRR